jgi:hypothetical protein
MQNRFTRWMVTIAAALAVSPVILAQTAPQTSQSGAAKATPDLSGVWYRRDSAPGIANPDGSDLVPPMQPWAAKVFDARQRVRVSRELDESGKPAGLVLAEGGEAAGLADARPYGLAIDPVMSCLPAGFPRVFLSVRTNFETFQVPGRVVMLFETHRLGRIIYTDGRPLTEGAPPSFMGQSVGKWDGDTLVVETTGLMGGDETWLDRAGHPHTDALRVTERIRRLDRDTLEIGFLFDDPKAYTRPWGGKQVYKLEPNWELMEAVLCLDHFEVDHLPEIRRLQGARGDGQ